MLPRTLLAGSLAVAAALAQNYTAHPIDNLASSASQNIPFAGNSTSWDEARSQYLFLAPYLPSTGGLITALELVPNTTYATPYERFEIWMDHRPNPTLSTTFAHNLTAAQLVFAQSPGSIAWVGGAWTTITLQTPFVYNGTDNLVMEVRKKINRPLNPPTTAVAHRILIYPRRADIPTPIWAYGAYGSGAVDAPTATTTYDTQILMRLRWLGPPTLAINSTRDTTGNANRSYFHIGATITLTVQGPPGNFHLEVLDFALNPVGLPFPPVNGELWLTPSFGVFNSGVLDGTGRDTASLPIPNNASLVGLPFYTEAVIAVYQPNGLLGWTTVVGGRVEVY